MKFQIPKPFFLRTSMFLLAILASFYSKAQIIIPVNTGLQSVEKDWVVNGVLDSVINKMILNSGGIICVNDNFVSVDTITLNKVKRVSSDSVILGKFLKKNQKKISSKEFWGLITDFGERRRFYNSKMYTVWERPSPYIYKIDNNWITSYYFSETLISPILILNKTNVDSCSLDLSSKEVLNNFISENYLGLSNTDRTNEDVFIEASVDVLNLLFQVMLIYMDSNSHSHSKSDYRAKKVETGRRK